MNTQRMKKEAANLKCPLVAALMKLLNLNFAMWYMTEDCPELERRAG